MPPIAILAGVGLAGSIGGAAISAHAAGSAAETQANAANYAATLQKQAADEALAFQKQQFATNQANIAPWLKAGQGGISQLASLLGVGANTGAGYGSLMQPFGEQFQAPTNVTEQNDPGYQFRLQEGMKALQNSAAAKGSLLSGGTAKALQQYGQDYASNEYQNVYNRSLGEYQQRYNIFQQNQANQFNRLASLSGSGQTAAGQLGSLGQSASGNVANILLGSGQQIGSDIQNAAAARASGYIGGANAYGGALSGIGNNLTQLYMLQNLMGGGSAANSPLGNWGGA